MIYCDHNATTPLRPEALEAMLPFLRDQFGNASSIHQLGSRARCAVEEARAEVAALIGATAAEIVFTSGGTESNNLAVEGVARVAERAGRPARTLTTAIEHSSLREPVRALVRRGWGAAELPLDSFGRVVLGRLAEVDFDDVRLVACGWANNEIGTVQPIASVSAACRSHGALLHLDATQAAGKIAIRADAADLMALSAHKLGGPKGVGALFVRTGVEIEPLLRGGGQERERRAGTENVAGIVGFGVACRLAGAELDSYAASCRAWRDGLWCELERAVPDCRRNSPDSSEDLPNTLNVSFTGVRGEAMVATLDLVDVAVASGSACAAGAGEPSHVLLALGRDLDEARNGVRFSCGRGNRMEEIEELTARVRMAVDRIRRARL